MPTGSRSSPRMSSHGLVPTQIAQQSCRFERWEAGGPCEVAITALAAQGRYRLS